MCWWFLPQHSRGDHSLPDFNLFFSRWSCNNRQDTEAMQSGQGSNGFYLTLTCHEIIPLHEKILQASSPCTATEVNKSSLGL